ncbi:single-stranded-DNA-specific exonuclease RecJ [Gudongella sp. DL1XJH-153]|uniref:single-stranded-DNA-specific exonuclease RecJ n=1 Tax=Gudongella sp. DL1XJH-153 TaxID=3409804 RepID=UPI003BB7E51F
MEKWFIKNNPGDISRIVSENKISKPLAKLLINRGLTEQNEIDAFLNPDIEKLHDPLLMHDMDAAGRLIMHKIETGKKILIVGDFDVDGIMSTYVLFSVLSQVGADVDFTIPDRIQDGYGINNHIVLKAKAASVDTIITCDNGIAAFEAIKTGKKMGMTMIITDHHDIPYIEKDGKQVSILPEADCVLNPKKHSCQYPYKNLCGAGVAFKLADHLIRISKLKVDIKNLLEMVAIATICDVVDLVGENRILVKEGLERLNNTSNLGLKALINESGLEDKAITVYHVGFVIGPSLNASGRLDSALLGLQLLLSKDEYEANEIAIKLRKLNDQRKSLTEIGTIEVGKMIEEKYINDKVLVAYAPETHESVAGIIAGRIKEKYNRPTIVLTRAKEGVKGSGRSIDAYNMFEELSRCRTLLGRFGGHPMAAGLSLKKENIDRLRECLNNNTNLEDEDLVKRVYIDMAMPLENISYEFIDDIGRLEPFGKGNPKPTFGLKGLNLSKAIILGTRRNVVKIDFDNPSPGKIEAIMFCDGDKWIEEVDYYYGLEERKRLTSGIANSVTMDIIFNPAINEYMGRASIQIVINNYRFDRSRPRG